MQLFPIIETPYGIACFICIFFPIETPYGIACFMFLSSYRNPCGSLRVRYNRIVLLSVLLIKITALIYNFRLYITVLKGISLPLDSIEQLVNEAETWVQPQDLSDDYSQAKEQLKKMKVPVTVFCISLT